jgi:hypothetical protein
MHLKAAVAAVDITPPIGVELSGYGYYLGRAATGVHDPLMARALVLEACGERVAIVACDLLGVSHQVAAATQTLVAEKASVPAHALLLACSHTHSGPATVPVRGCGEQDPAYVASLPQRLAAAVAEAAGALEPAEAGFARGAVPGLGHNRVEGDAGPLDDDLLVMAVRTRDGKPLAIALHATAHAVTQPSSNTLFSADWPGAASRQIEEAGGGQGLFLAGSCGDVNPTLAHTGRGDEAGRRVAEGVAALLPQIEYAHGIEIGATSRDVALSLAPILAEQLEAIAAEARPEAADAGGAARCRLEWAEALLEEHRTGATREALVTQLQAIRVGEGLLLAHGSELFCEYGQALKARFAPRPTFVVGYANDFVGYVPDPEDFARGGYAAVDVPRICGYFPFTSDVGSQLVAGLTEVSAEIGG